MPYIIVCSCALAALFILRFVGVGRLEALPRLEVAHARLIGRREIQSDAFEWSTRRGKTLLVIADGIGMGTRGRTAALAAADSIAHTFSLDGLTQSPAYFFRQAFHNANEAVLRYVPDGSAGASVLCAMIDDDKLYYALAGDCRAAVFRDSHLIPLSEGQTLDVLARHAFKRQKIEREEAKTVCRERRIYNYVGKDDFKDLEMFDVPVALKSGDCLVLMTDGVYDFCPSLDLLTILRAPRRCQWKADAVMQKLKTNDNPQQDNATIVLAQLRGGR